MTLNISKETQWNLFWIFSVVFSVSLALLAILATFDGADEGLEFQTVVTMSIDICGILVTAVITASIFYDRKMNMASMLFVAMGLETIALLFSEFVSFRYDGFSDYYVVTTIANYFVYGFCNTLLLTHWLYLRKYLNDRNARYAGAENTIYLCFFGILFLLMINPFTDVVFYTDRASGYYVSGPLIFAITILSMIMILCCGYCSRYFYDDKKRRHLLQIYSVLAMLALTTQIMSNDASSLCIFFVFMLLLIHGGFYVERGDEIIRKETEIMEQNVAMMVTQVQPYFLYTSLHSIANLEGNPPETQKAIEDFAKYLRSNLSTLSETTTIPFRKEMEHVQTYVDLEKLRFKDKLNVVYEVGDIDFEIPPLTLQMLVENAIKHGITQKEEGGTVTITTEETDSSHRVIVSDDGVGFDTSVPPSDESRSHVGIINITERLYDLLDGKLEVTSEVGRGTVAVVTIPKNTTNILLE